jgi:hypothetical protein
MRPVTLHKTSCMLHTFLKMSCFPRRWFSRGNTWMRQGVTGFLAVWSTCLCLIFCKLLLGASRLVAGALHTLAPPLLLACEQWTHMWPKTNDQLDMKTVKPTRCYTMVYWNLWIAQHVSGIITPIIRSLRLYRRTQRVAPHCQGGKIVSVGLEL